MTDDSQAKHRTSDSINRSNIAECGDAPSRKLAGLYLSMADALGNAAHNAIERQQKAQQAAQTATGQAIALLLGDNTLE